MKILIKTKHGNSVIMDDYTAKECEDFFIALNISRAKDATVTVTGEGQSYTVKSNDIVSAEFIF